MESYNRFLRRKEAAEFLDVSPRTLSNLMKRRAIPYYKVSRGIVLFNVDELLPEV